MAFAAISARRWFTAASNVVHGRAGATAIEYALIATLIAVAISATVMTLGQTVLAQFFKRVAAAFASAT
ncbi:pilus assembly protein Flp/PilA [uncultured Gammaproteobacteria bacterium]